MPKIPTFTTQARPTAEVGSVQSNIQAPIPTYLGTIQNTLSDYFVKEQALKDKTEATKEYLNLSLEFDTIQKGSIKNIDPSLATQTFQNQYQFLAKQKIDSMQNKGAAKLLKEKLDLDLITRSFEVTKGSRDQLNSEFINTWNTENELNTSKYMLAEGAEKNIYKSKILKGIESKNFYLNEGNLQLEEDIKKTKSTLLSLDLNNLISKNKLAEAKAIVTNLDVSKDLDAKTRGEFLNKIDKQIKTNEDKTLSEIGKSIIIDSKFNEGADTSALITDTIRSTYTNPETQKKVVDAVKKEQEERSTTITKKGSAEYYLSKNAALSQKYAVAIQDPNQFESYKEEADKLYAEKNVPLQYRTYLPYDKVKEIGDVIKENKNPNETLNYIKKLNATYGSDAMPGLFKQLTKDGLQTDLQIVMSTNSDSLKKDILSAASSKDLEQKAKTKLKDIELKTMKTNILNKTKKYQDIVLAQKSGNINKTEYLLSLETTLYNAALNKVVTQGMSTSNAVQEVTDAFLADYDTTQRTYFIPKDINGVPVVVEDVKDKADALLLSIETEDYAERFHGKDGFSHYATLAGFQNALPDNIKISTPEIYNAYVKDAMLNAIKKNPKWLLNSDSTGIVLYVDLANGTIPIVNKNGEKIEFLFTKPISRTGGEFIDYFFDEKMRKLQGTEFIEPGTGLKITLFNNQDLRETTYNIE
jgi:hypothetical protein